jgi:hypothetical protein
LDKRGYDKYGYNQAGYDKESYGEFVCHQMSIVLYDNSVADVSRPGCTSCATNNRTVSATHTAPADVNGYDKNGFNKEGYSKEGFNKYGLNKDGFNKDGYDK